MSEVPNGSTIVLTTLDEASSSQLATTAYYVSKPWMSNSTNYNEVVTEYQQLANAIFNTQRNTAEDIYYQ